MHARERMSFGSSTGNRRSGGLRSGVGARAAAAAGLGLALGLGLGGFVWVRSGAGDEILLLNGGRFEGVILPSDDLEPIAADKVAIQTTRTKTPIVIPRSQIKQVVKKTGLLDNYLGERAKAAALPGDVGARLALAEWCDSHELKPLATRHFEQVLELDPDNETARLKLGHVLLDGQWLTDDDAKRALGWVKIRGQWVSPEDRERLDARDRESTAVDAWTQRLRAHVGDWKSGNEERRRRGEAALGETRDPVAIPALVKLLGRDRDESRLLLVRILANMPEAEATDALASLVLVETKPAIRDLIEDRLKVRPEHADRVVKEMLPALRSKNQGVRGRAARVLALLDAQTAVPALVDALVSIETHQEVVTEFQPIVAGGVPTTFNGNVAGAAPSPLRQQTFGMVAQTIGPNGQPINYPVPIGGPTGMVVGTRAVPRMRIVQQRITNAEVLDALRRLTGADFGFDVVAWKRWIPAGFRPRGEVVRIVPQP